MRRSNAALPVTLLAAAWGAWCVAATAAAQTPRRSFALDDLARLVTVADPRFAPDGEWIAYTVATIDVERDKENSDLWMVRYDGSQQVQLTRSPDGETSPRVSPDGRWLAFLAARGAADDKEEDKRTQVYLLDRAGGEAVQASDVPGEVTSFAWSPDSTRLALIARDPDPDKPSAEEAAKKKNKTPKPIVIDRYTFKQDYVGYLTHRRAHLYLFDLASKRAELLTPGDWDEAMPAFSPDGRTIVFSSKRGGAAGSDPDRDYNWDLYLIETRAGATPRPLTTFTGDDGSPRADHQPVWSPNGDAIAYLRGTSADLVDQMYDGPMLALAAPGGGAPSLLTEELDRHVRAPRFSPDGASLLFTFEDDRSVQLARIGRAGGRPELLTPRGQVVRIYDTAANGRIVVLATTPDRPAELYAVESGTLRPLTRHNDALLAELALGATRAKTYRGADGTTVGAMVVMPPDFVPGRRYPTLLWIHGGPVGQDQHEFDTFAQLFAAQGYVVLQPNYRGSSGKGFAFSRAIARDWGHLEVKDVLAAVDGLIAQGIADPQRLVIGGWSYGGMTTNYTIASDQRFQAAVSIAGVSNMITAYGTDQYIVQYDHELGRPWSNIEPYLKVSHPFFHADRITTPTLFMCGEKDWNVPAIHSEQMFQALKSLGRTTQLVIYPGAHHGIDAPSYRRDLLARTISWFDRHLGKNQPAASAPTPTSR